MKETFILRTSELWSSRGVVHIRTIGYDPEDQTYIEYDARALLDDLPSLYRMAKQAIKQEEEWDTKKYVEFKQQLAEDWKGKPGRQKK